MLVFLTLLLGKLLSDPANLPGVQQERARMRALGSIVKAAYLMGVKDTLTVMLLVAGLLFCVFVLPTWLKQAPPASRQTPGEES